MSSFSWANSLSVSVRIYRALLVAYPKRYREHYETQMLLFFQDSFKDAFHHDGLPGVIDLWLHTFADLFVTALMERISESNQVMFSPKIVLWGGVASIFSGLFWVMAGITPSSGGVAIGLALALGLGGLAGLYSRQAGQGGKLGLAGYALGVAGTVLALAMLWWGFTSGLFSNLAIGGELAHVAPTVLILMMALVILSIGLALLGIASMRVKNPPRWRALPLGLGLLAIIHSLAFWLAYYVPLSQGRNPWSPWNNQVYIPVVLVLLGLGWIGSGIMLGLEADAKLVPPPPASV